MKPPRAANAELIDYTRTLEFLVGGMIGEGCSVILDERQYPVLLAFLERIAEIGEGTNFQLLQCIDHRPGYSVDYDLDGTPEQEREIDRLMAELVQSLGFSAGSIANPCVIADPAEILNRIHREDAEKR